VAVVEERVMDGDSTPAAGCRVVTERVLEAAEVAPESSVAVRVTVKRTVTVYELLGVSPVASNCPSSRASCSPSRA
jgi:hypothetical protein